MTSLLTAPNPVVHETTVRHGAAGHELYRQLDEEINGRLGTDVGFTALVRATPYPMDVAVVDGFRERYATIKRFQESTLALFNASLRGECDPEIAAMVLGDVPAHLGSDYHRQLTARQHHTPVFFRTDEPLPSKLSEIQCPGSGWCLAEGSKPSTATMRSGSADQNTFRTRSPRVFAGVLRARLGGQPLVSSRGQCFPASWHEVFYPTHPQARHQVFQL
ncbi:MAG: hypothetical protein U1F83_05955 [Verrucomicrobiota bacterium]